MSRKSGVDEKRKRGKKEMMETVWKSEKRYREIFENANDMILYVDEYGKIIDVNKKVEKIFGYKQDEIIGKNFAKLGVLGVKTLPRMIKLLVNVVKSGKAIKMIELEIKNKRGEMIPVEVSSNIIKENGKVRGFLTIIRDITDRKKMEEKYKVLYESSRDAIMTLAPPTWGFISGNPSTIRMFGAKDEKEFTSSGPGDLSPEYQPDGQLSSVKAKKMIGKAMKEGSNFFEWTHKRIDGKEFPATVLLTRIELSGKKLLQATVRDITKQKEYEKTLKERRRFLSDTLNDMLTFVAIIRPDGEVVFINNTPLNIGGMKLENVLGKKFYDCYWWTYSDEVRQTVRKDIEHCASGKTLKRQIKIRTRDGFMWIDFSVHPIYDEGGNVKYIVPEGRDISEQKRTEEELKRSKTHLESKVAELERFSNMSVGRELRMIELKKRIRELDALLESKGMKTGGEE